MKSTFEKSGKILECNLKIGTCMRWLQCTSYKNST